MCEELTELLERDELKLDKKELSNLESHVKHIVSMKRITLLSRRAADVLHGDVTDIERDADLGNIWCL